MLNISKAKSLAVQGKKLITIYGEGGGGKTTFATMNGYAPKTLIINVEDDGGMISINKLPAQIGDNIDGVVVDYSKGSPAGALVSIIDEVKKLDYDIIIFDPFSNVRNKQANWLANTTQGTTLTQKQWGEVKAGMDIIFDRILELKQRAHIIIIAHEEIYQTTDSVSGKETFVIRPAVGKGLVEKVIQYSDEVVRVSNNGSERTFDLGAHQNVVGKTRQYGSLPQENKIFTGLTIDQLLYNQQQ